MYATVQSEDDRMRFGDEILHYDIIDSTNSEAKRLCEKEVVHGRLIVADRQTVGRGRRGREWVSSSDDGIWMSYVIKPSMGPYEASALTLIAAMAVSKAILKTTGLKTDIKWPNDVVCHGRKLSGILTEMQSENDRVKYVVIGIGINVNNEEFPKELCDVATSVYIESGYKAVKSDIIKHVSIYLEQYYNEFVKTCDMTGLKDEYEALLVNSGKQVYVDDGEQVREYIAIGINKQGELVVKDNEGLIKEVRAGEVSVRGIYGYV